MFWVVSLFALTLTVANAESCLAGAEDSSKGAGMIQAHSNFQAASAAKKGRTFSPHACGGLTALSSHEHTEERARRSQISTKIADQILIYASYLVVDGVDESSLVETVQSLLSDFKSEIEDGSLDALFVKAEGETLRQNVEQWITHCKAAVCSALNDDQEACTQEFLQQVSGYLREHITASLLEISGMAKRGSASDKPSLKSSDSSKNLEALRENLKLLIQKDIHLLAILGEPADTLKSLTLEAFRSADETLSSGVPYKDKSRGQLVQSISNAIASEVIAVETASGGVETFASIVMDLAQATQDVTGQSPIASLLQAISKNALRLSVAAVFKVLGVHRYDVATAAERANVISRFECFAQP